MKSCTTVRLGCVDLPAFPLQLLLRRHPEWRAYPAAVVDQDKPQGLLLWVNEKARRQGVLPGLRYAAAFSLAATLRAGQVLPAEIDKAGGELVKTLMRFTPEVEPANEEPGVFWLNGAGLQRLYGSPQQWAHAIYQNLRRRGFAVNLAVGFTRFGTYAIAKAKRGATIFHDPAAERTAARKTPLQRLNIEPEFRDALLKLGIKTVGDLLLLPSGGVRERFGKEAHRVYRMAADDLWMPLEPKSPEEALAQKYILDDPEDDATRLLFVMKQSLHPLLAVLAKRHQALVTLWISFVIDHGGRIRESLRPAAPTLDAVQIAVETRRRHGLVLLRIEAQAPRERGGALLGGDVICLPVWALDLVGIGIGAASAFAAPGAASSFRLADAVAAPGFTAARRLGWNRRHDALLQEHNDRRPGRLRCRSRGKR